MSSNSSEVFNYGDDKETGLALIFMSSFLWFSVMFGFKLNSVYDYINIKELGLSYLYFVVLLMLYLIITILTSLKLAIKHTKLEAIFILIFAVTNGMIFQALLNNLMAVNDLNIKPDVIGFSFCGSLLLGTIITSSFGFIEQKMGVLFSYLTPFCLLLIFGVFFLIVSFYVNDFNDIKKYFIFVLPMLLINGVYASIIYRAYKTSKTYVNAQLTNISSILFIPPLFVVALLCF